MNKTKTIVAPRRKWKKKKCIPYCYNLNLQCPPSTPVSKPWKKVEILRGLSLEVCP